MSKPGLIVAVPLGLFAVARLCDALERWLFNLWTAPRHRPGEALRLAIGPLLALGFAAGVIALAVMV